MENKILRLALLISGFIIMGLSLYLNGITGNVIGINRTTRIMGVFGLLLVIIAAIVENIEGEKFKKDTSKSS